MDIFYVGKHIFREENHVDDSMQGIFDNERKAVAACKDRSYYIIQFILNEELKEEPEITIVKYPQDDRKKYNKWHKYLDGVEFTLEKLKSFLEQNCNKKCKIDLEAREEGYYAAHINFKHMFEVISIDFDTEFVEMSIEIQITTQLQELIKRFLHRYYEKRRLRKKTNEKTKWQWNYRSNEFATNYMGHILHYIEGMIMDIRERIKEEEI